VAKAGIAVEIEPFQHRDPVTGSVKTFFRNKHARQSSVRLKRHQACVREGMLGFTARGGNAAQDALAVRARFTQVTQACAGRAGGRRATG
jgi:hypothetical protein